VPREVLVAAWPGEPRLLERLLGGPAPATGERMETGDGFRTDGEW